MGSLNGIGMAAMTYLAALSARFAPMQQGVARPHGGRRMSRSAPFKLKVRGHGNYDGIPPEIQLQAIQAAKEKRQRRRERNLDHLECRIFGSGAYHHQTKPNMRESACAN